MSIQHIAKKINEAFPLDAAQTKWDNVGVLIDTGSHYKNMMLTIDITDNVIEECVNRGISNIVAYHPVIFDPIKNIQSNDIVAKLFKHRINVFCPHTSWDFTINRYIYSLLNNGTFIENAGTNYLTIREAIIDLKEITGLNYLRVAFGKKHEMESVPIQMVVGAGAAFKQHDFRNNLIITGEMSHHALLYSVRNNNTVILLEHSNSERIALFYFQKIFNRILDDYDIFVSNEDRDPINIY